MRYTLCYGERDEKPFLRHATVAGKPVWYFIIIFYLRKIVRHHIYISYTRTRAHPYTFLLLISLYACMCAYTVRRESRCSDSVDDELNE